MYNAHEAAFMSGMPDLKTGFSLALNIMFKAHKNRECLNGNDAVCRPSGRNTNSFYQGKHFLDFYHNNRSKY